jgi:hypothetical protein
MSEYGARAPKERQDPSEFDLLCLECPLPRCMDASRHCLIQIARRRISTKATQPDVAKEMTHKGSYPEEPQPQRSTTYVD